jgi:hypothetical protein
MDEAEARHRVRQLLLSGDNTVKNREGAARFARARERYAQARRVAVEAGLGSSVLRIIDLRLEALGAEDRGSLSH